MTSLPGSIFLPTPVLVAWDLAVGLALLGLGWLVLRLAGVRERSVAAAGIVGTAAFLVFSSVANRLHLLGARTMYATVTVGLLCLVLSLPSLRAHLRQAADTAPYPRGRWLPLPLACGLLGSLLFANLLSPIWNTDDLEGYIPIAVKAAQAGALQPDPYSERRLTTGLGGGATLDALMLAPGDLRALHFIDGVFGLFLFAAATWTVARRWGLAPFGAGLLLCLLPFLPMLQINLTIVYLSAASFLVLALLLSEDSSVAQEVLVSLVAAGVCCTKSTNVPFAVLLLGSMLGLRRLLDRTAPLLRPVVLITLLTVLFLTLFSLAQRAAEGTYLYPLLGRGFHESAYGHLPSPAQLGSPAFVLTVATPLTLLLLGGCLYAWSSTSVWRATQRSAALGFLLATVLAVPIIAYSTGGETMDRYTAPFVVPATLVFFAVLVLRLQAPEPVPARTRLTGLALGSLFLLYFVGFIGWNEHWYQPVLLPLTAYGAHPPELRVYQKLLGPDTLRSSSARLAAAQAAVPPGAVAIEFLPQPGELNFRRNTIYLCDWPGMAGPAPVPLGEGPEALRAYLQRQGIQFVLFEYGRYSDPVSNLPAFLAKPRDLPSFRYLALHPNKAHSRYTWARMQAAVASDVWANLFQLSHTLPHLYDDGDIAVFSLN